MKKNASCKFYFQHRKVLKILIMSKIILFLVLISSSQLFSKGFGQTSFDLKVENANLKKVFKEVERKSSFHFLYNDDVLAKNEFSSSFNIKNGSIDSVLSRLLAQTDLTYKISSNNTVIIYEKPADAQFLRISGMVTDTLGNPIIGASVVIAGTKQGTVTDNKGAYSISAKKGDVLHFSYVGYISQDVTVQDLEEIDVHLVQTVSSLDDIVMIGYGTQKKKDLTGAISSVDVSKMQNRNPTSVQEALRANVAGLNVGFSSGAKPGGSLQVRGTNSLSASTSPLIVVDGSIYNGALADINPQDIATIDVLKDASAAAVYGAKAASGVVAITTKRGQTGKPVVNFNSNISVATMAVNQPVYQGQGFVDWRSDVQRSMHNFNEKPYEYNDPRKLPADVSLDDWMAYDASTGDPVTAWLGRLVFKPIEITDYQNNQVTNWYDMVFQNGVQQNHTISLSGGTKNLHYYWSAGYLNNDGVVVGDTYSTVQSRVKLEADVTKFLTVGINTSFADRDESSVPVDWNQITRISPYGGMWNTDTTDYRYSPQDDAGSGARNPLYGPKYTDRMKKYYTLNSIIYGKIKLPFGITYTANFTPQFEWYQYFNANSSINQDYTNLGGNAERDQHQVYQWQIDNIINWNHTFNGLHHFEVTLLANSEKYQYWSNNMQAQGFDPSDVLGYHNFSAAAQQVISSDDEYSTGAALMARLFYSYKDRYMITLSTRRDGYSAFGQKYPWANFPSAAFGWVFTQEPFMKPTNNWLNYGKLRVSYGINGNRDIGRYVALANLTTGKYLEINPDGTTSVVSQLWVNRMQNSDLQWERTAAFNIGLDFGIFNNIVSGSIEAYKSKTTNLLMNRSLPDVDGFSNIQTNLGQLDNKGLEITLNTHNIHRENFSWNSTFNFSLNRNKIVHLYGDYHDVLDANGNVIGQKEQDDISNGWFIGHPIDAIWDAKVIGVYKTSEADEAAKYGKVPGDFKVQDVNNDGLITNADRQFLGNSQPRFRWTLSNDFQFFKNFDLSFLIYSYWGQMATFNQAKNTNPVLERINAYVYPYWTPENQVNDFARPLSSDGGASYNVYRKQSFIRLDNVALAYSVPGKVLKRFDIQALKFYFTVKNVAVYTPDWDYWDPENGGPTPRTFTFGLNVTL